MNVWEVMTRHVLIVRNLVTYLYCISLLMMYIVYLLHPLSTLP